jgi:hypothetical protein
MDFWRRHHVSAPSFDIVKVVLFTRPPHWLHTSRFLGLPGPALDNFFWIRGFRPQASMLGLLTSPVPGGGKAPSSHLWSVLMGPVFIRTRLRCRDGIPK